MSTLIVLLPPRDPAVPTPKWQQPELPFVLLDKSGRTQYVGLSALALLPRASATVLMVAASDLLLIPALLPPLRGPRLRQALPNIVEDQLIQDPQTCHIAVDPKPLTDGRQLLAIIDRGWFRLICESFINAGHRSLRAVPITRCLPPAATLDVDVPAEIAETVNAGEPATAGAVDVATSLPGVAPVIAPGVTSSAPMVAAVLRVVAHPAPTMLLEGVTGSSVNTGVPRVELAIARGVQGEGLVVPANAVNATLGALAGVANVELHMLTEVPEHEPSLARNSPAQLVAHIHDARSLPFGQLARRALDCRFDLCQFEFAARPWSLDRTTLRRLRLPVLLAASALAIAIIGANVQWLMLARQRDAINTEMAELLLDAFPKTTVVLDAPDQMARQLQHLRIAAGELSADDFLPLADGFARSLSPVPVNSIAALDYHDRRLDVTFKPEVKVDPDLPKRLARHDLSGAVDSNTGKWTVRSGQ